MMVLWIMQFAIVMVVDLCISRYKITNPLRGLLYVGLLLNNKYFKNG